MSKRPIWKTVGELCDAFSPDSYTPIPTGDLEGKSITLSLEDGRIFTCRFDTAEQLVWSPAGEPTQNGDTTTYFAAVLRDRLYFVDFIWTEERATTVSLALDLGRDIATVVITQLPDAEAVSRSLLDRIAAGDELTAVSVGFFSAAIDAPFTAETPRHPETADLIGGHAEYTYSPTERYEHYYLNESLYGWHCLSGDEVGLADTDRCRHLKLADDLYLFTWWEKIIPAMGIVALDFEALRTTGKIVGYSGDTTTALANFPVGAFARRLDVCGPEQKD